jgi:hypothetical protein
MKPVARALRIPHERIRAAALLAREPLRIYYRERESNALVEERGESIQNNEERPA